MGHGIAQVAAQVWCVFLYSVVLFVSSEAGYQVVAVEAKQEALTIGNNLLHLLKKKLKKKILKSRV